MLFPPDVDQLPPLWPLVACMVWWLVSHVSSIFARRCLLFLHPSSSIIRLKVVGHKPKKQPGRVIFMANHLSNSDAFFLSAAMLPWETKYVAKASLFSVRHRE